MLTRRSASRLSLAIILSANFAAPARAQMIQQPWSFTQQNRASIASLMQQVENSPAEAAAVAPPTTLICGGGTGQSAATGNSTCIILNQATGQIEIGQDSAGNQGATGSSNAQTQTAASTAMDEALSSLSGH